METTQKKSFFFEIFKFVLIAVLIVVPFRIFIAQPFIVSGASMDPTFGNGDYLITDQISYKFESPHRGDVIIFRYPKDTTKFFIKRVIGLPNETVEIHSGVIVIKNSDYPDGFTLSEPYISSQNKKVDNLPSTKIKDDEYFVLGDNRAGSLDSRSWGTVSKDLIAGKPVIRILPLGRLGLLPGEIKFGQ